MGGSFGTRGGHFKIDFCVILVVSGVFWRPWVPKGASKGGRVEKVTEKVVRGSFMGPSLGPPLEPKSNKCRKEVVLNSTSKNIVRKVLHKRCLGTSSNPMTTKPLSYLTFPPGAPKQPKIVFNGYPCATSLGGFVGRWVPFWRIVDSSKNCVAENHAGHSRATRSS